MIISKLTSGSLEEICDIKKEKKPYKIMSIIEINEKINSKNWTDPIKETEEHLTGDFFIYTFQEKTPQLYIADFENNLFFKEKYAASELIKRDAQYNPKDESIKQVTKSGFTNKIDLAKINFKKLEKNILLEISLVNYNNYPAQDKKLVEIFYGRGQNNLNSQNRLMKEGMEKIQIILEDPTEIKKSLKRKSSGIVRYCTIQKDLENKAIIIKGTYEQPNKEMPIYYEHISLK